MQPGIKHTQQKAAGNMRIDEEIDPLGLVERRDRHKRSLRV